MTRSVGGEGDLVEGLRRVAQPLAGDDDLEPLLASVGDSRVVMLGEASHGTSEYYTWRARITRRLVEEHGFSFVAVEGDWPDCYRINRFVKWYGDHGEPAEVLRSFRRWPTWMWANWEVAALCAWLRQHNRDLAEDQRVGFYGLDVYSLWESLDEIVRYLERTDPAALPAARRAFACFEPFLGDEQAYAEAANFGTSGRAAGYRIGGSGSALVAETCEDEVIALLSEVRHRAEDWPEDHEGPFSAEQNARAVVGAERYYRTMIAGGRESWNERDRHMMETLDALLQRQGQGSRGVVWAHNTHVGDARATDMAHAGMLNIGQLARERYGDSRTTLVGFGSHRGSVVAGKYWGAPMERMILPAAREDSWEGRLHELAAGDLLLLSRELPPEAARKRDHRAVGVVYRPDSERFANYVPTELPRRYDAFLFLDETQALNPLQVEAEEEEGPPETFPWGV